MKFDDSTEDISRLRGTLALISVANLSLRPFTGLPVMTHGFFPGGNGLYQGVNASRTPIGGALILGSNFGRYQDFVDEQGRLLVLDERNNRTWTPLLDRLQAAGIDAENCFFTNAWPFLHVGDGNLGPVADWLNDSALMAACVRFFQTTFAAIQPRLIVAMGTGPAAFLGHVWPESLGTWRGYAIQHLDDLPVTTVGSKGGAAVCVAITHPSMPNAWRRRPPYQHRNGEVRLLTEARLETESISKQG